LSPSRFETVLTNAAYVQPMTQKTVLIVDDEATQRRLAEIAVVKEGYLARTLDNGSDAIALLSGPEGADIHAVILDFSMPKVTGLDVMRAISPLRPALPMIMLTAHSSLNTAVEAMRAGASDFLVKPASPDRIKAALAAAFSANDAKELRPLTEKLADTKQLTFEQLVGQAPAFLDAIAMARKAAAAAIPLLIEGESGVGKELIAQSVHSASPRSRKAFVAVNCGAIPANLIESTLFGHEKGAFTGAIDKASGRFVDADGGTLFLDEIGEMPLDAQVKLLRVLQEGEVQPVGGKAPRKVDVRVISATNRDLGHEVRAGRFREDLFYRLNVVSVAIPPLRDRRGDIPALAHHFLAQIAASESVAARTFSVDAMALLAEFSWPGNVRQLQNAIFRAAVLCDDSALHPSDFPQLSEQAHVRRLRRSSDQSGRDATLHGERRQSDPAPSVTISLTDAAGQFRSFSDIEAEILQASIRHYKGRMSEVAKRLGIGRSTLYRKLGELNLLP
jgi:DNA-binding NtrC family response regulator